MGLSARTLHTFYHLLLYFPQFHFVIFDDDQHFEQNRSFYLALGEAFPE